MGNNGNGKSPLAFQVPPGTPILGQQYALKALFIPITAVITCNCTAPGTDLQIILSAPATCPTCHRTIGASFNPTNGQIEIALLATPELAAVAPEGSIPS